MEREGYRANAGDRCFFCKAELLDVLTPLAAEHGLAHVATGTNADDAVAGFRPGHPRRRRARRDHAAARRRPDQGAGPGGLAPLGPADLGQARRRLPVVAGRVRRRGDAVPAGPGRAGRGRRARRCSAAGVPAAQPAGPRPRRPGLGRGRRRPARRPRCARARRWPTRCSRRRRRRRLRRRRPRPARLPVRLDERAAAGPTNPVGTRLPARPHRLCRRRGAAAATRQQQREVRPCPLAR